MRSPSALPILRREVAQSWRSTLGWTVGVVAALVLYLPLFPALGGADSQMAQLIAKLPSQLVSALGYGAITTGAGYTEATFYGLLGFVMIVIAATSWSTAAIAGDEEDGTLELTLAHGVSRRQLVLERTLAIALRLAWLTTVAAIVVLALNPSAQLGLDVTNVVAVSVAYFGVGLVSATLGLAAGALSGRRIASTSAAADIAVLGYALNAVGSQSPELGWLRDYSPYGWAFRHVPLANGIDGAGLGLLCAFCIVCVLIALFAFQRRDIRS